jgi:hypothetical protein
MRDSFTTKLTLFYGLTMFEFSRYQMTSKADKCVKTLLVGLKYKISIFPALLF